MLTCPVTVWRPVKPRYNGDRGVITGKTGPCNEPVDRGGLCTRHADDRDRLAVDR